MTVTALGLAPLRWKDVILTAASPTVGDINIYNTLTAGTALAPTLPQAAIGTIGSVMLLERDPNDTGTNALTFTAYSGEFFTSGATTLSLPDPGMQRTLQIVAPSGVNKWKIIGGNGISNRLAARQQVTTVAAPTASQTINTDITDVAKFTGVNTALTLTTSGTPYDEQTLVIVLTDNGTSQHIWLDTTKFTMLGYIDSFPVVTPYGRRMRMEFVYDSGYAKFVMTRVDPIGY